MQDLSAADLLRVWGAGAALSMPQRALVLLAAADPGASAMELSRLTLGERDARLIDLRELCFGRAVSAVAACPACGERADLSFSTGDLRAPAARSDEIFLVADGEGGARIRAITTLDLLALEEQPPDDPVRALAERCLIDGGPLTDAGVAAISERLRAADSQAEVSIALTCPACGRAWAAIVDVASFLWREIEAWAQRILDDVHALAAAYHWREEDILAMTAWRRQEYLRRIEGG